MSTFPAQRPNFFEGQYLGAEDLTALVEYFRGQDARQVLGHHTWGIAMGLDLVELQAPDGTLEIFVQPGLAFDGYGRLIVVINRHKLDTSRFSDSGETPIWIHFDETETQGVRKGFEVCSSTDNFSRVNENFDIDIGLKDSVLDRNNGVFVNGAEVIDPREALRAVDDTAALVCDGSIPHQDIAEQGDERRWLVPLGLVHWQGASVSFQALSDEQRIRSRKARHYVGNVAESLFAAAGIIRLRDRHTAFDATQATDVLCANGQIQSQDFHICKQQMLARELVWLEGNVRVTGDCRLFAGRLEFRDQQGRDYIARNVDGSAIDASTPLVIQRQDNNTNNGSDLQILIGESDDGRNRLSIGHARVDTSAGPELCDAALVAADHVVIQDDGKTGIGAVDSTLVTPLTIRGIDAQGELMSFENAGGSRLWHWNLGENNNSVNLVETSADASRLFIEAGGNVGLGTDSPVTTLHLASGSDVTDSDTSGYLVIGSDGGLNVGFDDNEIQARNNDSAATLYLQHEGGDLAIHPSSGSRVIVKDSGDVGIGTSSPAAKLDLGSVGGGTWIRAGDGDDSGRFWVEYGDQNAPLLVLSDFDDPPRIQFQQTGSGSETAPQRSSWIGHAGGNTSNLAVMGGDFAIGHQSPICRLHVQDSINGDASNVSSYVTCIENTSSGTSADVLALKVGRNNPSGASNFITFFDVNSAVGRIEGNGSGGVVYRTNGADFAECLALQDQAEQLHAGDVVGVHQGRVSHRTSGANQVLVVTDSAAVVANSVIDDPDPRVALAFIGQVRVNVRGPVRCGDLVIPSGREDGTATALDAAQLEPRQLGQIIGQAWESADEPGSKRVNCAISMLAGLGGRGLSELLAHQERRLQALEQALADLSRRFQEGEQ